MTLGEIIAGYRKDHGISQRKMSALCDVSTGYISMIEKGKNPKTGEKLVPTIPLLQKLAKALGMSVDELLAEADDMEVDISSKEPKLVARKQSRKEIAIDWLLNDSTKEEKIEIIQLLTTRL